MTPLRSLTKALLATALLALVGCGGSQEAAPDVAQAAPARIEIAPSTVLLTAPGARKSLSAKVFDAAGNPLTTAVAWTSSRPAEVTVDAAGVITAAGSGGSSQVTARIGSLASPPLLVVHTPVPAGTVLVADANINGDLVETDPDAPPGVGSTYVVRLVGVAAPRVGELLMNTESQPVAGRVTAVESANGEHRVTLALVPGPEMFPNLALDEAIDLNQAEVDIPAALRDQYDIQRNGNTFTFVPKPGQFAIAGAAPSDRQTIASAARQRPLATATPVGTAALPPFTNCEATLLGAGGAAGLPVGLSLPPQFTFSLNNRLDVKYSSATGLERFVIHGEPSFTVNGGLKALIAFEGKVTCEVELLVIRIPVGGPLSLLIGGLVPVGVGAELAGKVTVASVGISTNVVGKTVFDVGIACPGGGDCSLVNTFGPVDLKPAPVIDVPSLGDLRLEPSLSIYAFVKASVGNPFLKKLRFDALSVKVGAAARASLAPMSTQIADPLYKSDYKLLTELRAGAGTQLSGLAAMLGLRAISFVDLLLSTTLASSPLGTVAADKSAFVRGDTVNFTVKLDASKVEFPPAIGPYNVKQIVLVRRIDLTSQQEVARITAASGQTEFAMPFIAENSGRADEFFAFVVTALAPVDFLALELGQATAPAAPDNVRQTVQIPTQLTGPTTFTVTAESRAADGGLVPVPNAVVSIVNFVGCATLDRFSAPTNASGVATFTVTPAASCLQLSFLVDTTVGGALVARQQVTPAIVFPVFEGDLELVFAGALALAAHLEEITGALVIKSVAPGTESFTNVSLPNLKRVGGRVEVLNAVSVQLPVLESVGVGGLTVSSDALRSGLLLSSFEAPALRQTPSIDIRNNPALRTLAIGPVRVERDFNVFSNGFSSFDQFSSGIVVGRFLQIAFNTGFNNQTANDFVSRVTFLEGGRGVVQQNTGP